MLASDPFSIHFANGSGRRQVSRMWARPSRAARQFWKKFSLPRTAVCPEAAEAHSAVTISAPTLMMHMGCGTDVATSATFEMRLQKTNDRTISVT
jgi:hypothetical protein